MLNARFEAWICLDIFGPKISMFCVWWSSWHLQRVPSVSTAPCVIGSTVGWSRLAKSSACYCFHKFDAKSFARWGYAVGKPLKIYYRVIKYCGHGTCVAQVQAHFGNRFKTRETSAAHCIKPSDWPKPGSDSYFDSPLQAKMNHASGADRMHVYSLATLLKEGHTHTHIIICDIMCLSLSGAKPDRERERERERERARDK